MKYAWRFLSRHPGFTAVAVGTLALGLGMSTAMFGAEYAIALKPFPFPHPEQIVTVGARSRKTPDERHLSEFLLEAIGNETASLALVSAAMPVTVTVRTASTPELVTGEQVSGRFFDVYGTSPILGRTIGPADTTRDAQPVVVLSYALWQRLFGGAPDVIGRAIDLSVNYSNVFMPFTAKPQPFLVIGVMPSADRFPLDDALWVPLIAWKPDPRMAKMGPGPQVSGPFSVAGRLREGVATPAARLDLRSIGERWLRANPDADQQWLLNVVALREATTPDYATAVLLFVAAVNAVLVLACVSLGGLLAARTRARHRELAIREALGAGRHRIVQQILVESLVLTMVGGAMGLLVAWADTGGLRALAPPEMTALHGLTLDWPVLAYAAALCLVGGVAIGALPALHLVTGRRPTALRLSDGVATSPRRAKGTRRLLIAAQIALVFPLVTGAMLALRSFDRLINVQLGYRTDHILVMNVRLSGSVCGSRDFSRCLGTVDTLLDRVRALPGVLNAALSNNRPFAIPFGITAFVDGEESNPIQTQWSMVTPDYFHTMGVPLLAGRLFDRRDGEDADKVAIVNDTFAREYFAGHSIGRRLTVPGRPAGFAIVGEVADANDRALRARPQPAFYLPFAQSNLVARPTVIVRTSTDPAAFEGPARAAVSAVDPDAPVTDVATLDHIVATQAAGSRFNSTLLGAFASFGLVVALLGIYGLVAYAVGERLREFGVRRAVGASSADLVRLVFGEGLRAVGGGLLCGLGLAVLAGHWYQSQLFAISPTDPSTLGAVAALIVLVAGVAYGLPARRATEVDPIVVLRRE